MKSIFQVIKQYLPALWKVLKKQNLLSKHDTYGARFFDNRFSDRITRQNVVGEKGETIFYYTGFDYKEFKLFFLSLFLRASLSDLPIMKFKFLEKDEIAISELILHDNPRKDTDYPVSMVFHRRHPNELSSHIYTPRTMREHIHSIFYNNAKYDGVIITLITDLTQLPQDIFADSYLKEDGTMWVLLISDNERDLFYKTHLNIPIDKAFLPEKKYLIPFNSNINLSGIKRGKRKTKE